MPIIVHSGKPFYKTKEACERIGRCKNAVLQWIRSGDIKDVEFAEAGYRTWTEEDIERFRKHRDEIKKNRKRKKVEATV